MRSELPNARLCRDFLRRLHLFEIFTRIEPVVFNDMADSVNFGMITACPYSLSFELRPLRNTGNLHAAPDEVTGIVSPP